MKAAIVRANTALRVTVPLPVDVRMQNSHGALIAGKRKGKEIKSLFAYVVKNIYPQLSSPLQSFDIVT